MNIPGPVLIAGHSIMRSGSLHITISRSWSAIIQLVRVVHESATHDHKRGARFPVFCCDILPIHSENEQVTTNDGSYSAPLTTFLSSYKNVL